MLNCETTLSILLSILRKIQNNLFLQRKKSIVTAFVSSDQHHWASYIKPWEKQHVDRGFWSVLFWTKHVAKSSTSQVVSRLSNIMKNKTSKILLLSFHILKRGGHVKGALRNLHLWWQGQTNTHLKITILNKTNKKNSHLWVTKVGGEES